MDTHFIEIFTSNPIKYNMDYSISHKVLHYIFPASTDLISPFLPPPHLKYGCWWKFRMTTGHQAPLDSCTHTTKYDYAHMIGIHFLMEWSKYTYLGLIYFLLNNWVGTEFLVLSKLDSRYSNKNAELHSGMNRLYFCLSLNHLPLSCVRQKQKPWQAGLNLGSWPMTKVSFFMLKLIMLISVNMPIIVGILTFISMIKFEIKKTIFFSPAFQFLWADENWYSVELSMKKDL